LPSAALRAKLPCGLKTVLKRGYVWMPAVFGSSSRAQAAVEVVHQLDYTLVPASHGLQLLFADVMQ
jgi:hypothetical protein